MRIAIVLAFALLSSGTLAARPAEPPKPASSPCRRAAEIRANGACLRFVDEGHGPAVVFVHGGLTDLNEWAPVAAALGPQIRAIRYSRRHNQPNENPGPRASFSVYNEVEDLAGIIQKLGIGPAHVVGVSYGGEIALLLGTRHPDLVRSLTVVDPAVLGILPTVPGGTKAFAEFRRVALAPARQAFARHDKPKAIAAALDYFAGPGATKSVPAELRQALLDNVADWRAIVMYRRSFPFVSVRQLRSMAAPTLILQGSRTKRMFMLVNRKLAGQLPHATLRIINGGSHDVCSEQSAACATAIANFIGKY